MSTFIYSTEERRVILYILSEIMLADEYVHPKEQEFFDSVYQKLNADSSDIDTMEHIDSDYAKYVLVSMDGRKKEALRKTFLDMAMADDAFDHREKNVLDYYFK